MRGISALRPLVRPAPLPRAAYARALQARNFSGTSIRLNEQKKDAKEDKKDEKKEKEQKKRGYDEDAGPPQSPFKVFLQVFKEEIEKNQGWQQNVKQLSGEVDKMADSKAMKAAREMYERTRVSRCSEVTGTWWKGRPGDDRRRGAACHRSDRINNGHPAAIRWRSYIAVVG